MVTEFVPRFCTSIQNRGDSVRCCFRNASSCLGHRKTAPPIDAYNFGITFKRSRSRHHSLTKFRIPRTPPRIAIASVTSSRVIDICQITRSFCLNFRNSQTAHRLANLLLAAISAARSGRFMHDDLAEPGALGLQFYPEPGGHFFNGWVLQPFDVVEIRVVQDFQKRFHRRADFGMIINPAARWIDIVFHRYLDLETMAVHAPTLVTLGRLRQNLRRFKSEILGQPCSHVTENTITTTALSSRTAKTVRDLTCEGCHTSQLVCFTSL